MNLCILIMPACPQNDGISMACVSWLQSQKRCYRHITKLYNRLSGSKVTKGDLSNPSTIGVAATVAAELTFNWMPFVNPGAGLPTDKARQRQRLSWFDTGVVEKAKN